MLSDRKGEIREGADKGAAAALRKESQRQVWAPTGLPPHFNHAAVCRLKSFHISAKRKKGKIVAILGLR
jgi:hypothetical protein